MLKLAGVKEADTVIDLGCGDGRIVVAAVKEFKAKQGVGIELSPERVRLSKSNAEKAGVADQVEIREGDVLKLEGPVRGDRRHAVPAAGHQRAAEAGPPQDAQARLAGRLARLRHGRRTGGRTRKSPSRTRRAATTSSTSGRSRNRRRTKLRRRRKPKKDPPKKDDDDQGAVRPDAAERRRRDAEAGRGEGRGRGLRPRLRRRPDRRSRRSRTFKAKKGVGIDIDPERIKDSKQDRQGRRASRRRSSSAGRRAQDDRTCPRRRSCACTCSPR